MFAKETEFCVARGRILCATRMWRHNCPPDRKPKNPQSFRLRSQEHEIRKRSPSSNAIIIIIIIVIIIIIIIIINHEKLQQTLLKSAQYTFV